MCTAFSFLKNSFYFGRNMDIEYTFGESVVITPRGFKLPLKRLGTLTVSHALIGMASITEGYPLYAEAANEKGLCMAGLNFPGNAAYTPESEIKKKAAAPYELILYILGICGNLSEAEELLTETEIADIPFSPSLPLAPLHWIVSDASGSIVIESTAEGLRIYDNPYGVLTNNPPFPFHRENIRQFLHLSAEFPENRLSTEHALYPFGQGAGAIGLPGDYSPASRFVKAFFCKTNSVCVDSEDSCTAQVFHILDSVAMVRGTVLTPDGKPDFTTYSCCINASKGIYYYKTYENSRVTEVALTKERKNSQKLLVFPLRTEPDLLRE